MPLATKQKVAIAAIVVASVAWVIVGAKAQSQPASVAAGLAPKMTEETFKNIQVLKGVPADQLMPAMGFIAASLGVGCDHCHVAGAFEKDDKKPKQMARQMMQMMFAINKENFEGRREVTCYSCHHGSNEPVSVPTIAPEEAKMEKPGPPGAAAPTAPTLPTPEQILDKYIQAIGGADALQKISSRVEKGKATVFGGRQVPVEIFIKAPDKRASVMHLPMGDNTAIYDGNTAWMSNPGRPVRELGGGELDAAKLDADIQFPLDAKQMFSELKVRGIEKIDGHDTLFVTGRRQGNPPIDMYFDQQSGLLVREMRYTETPLGRFPTQVDYSDYRLSGGVKIPFQWTQARPGNSSSTQLEEVQNNVPVDDSKFAKPPDLPPARSPMPGSPPPK
jgi:photosynthetic reaction center cytochrome c subunit